MLLDPFYEDDDEFMKCEEAGEQREPDAKDGEAGLPD
jgi:hypothetical protein